MRLTKVRVLIAAAAFAAPLAISTITPQAGSAATATATIKVMDWNMCGYSCNAGGTSSYTSFAVLLLVDRPQVVTLEEVCSSQTTYLLNQMKNLWPNAAIKYYAKRSVDSNCPTIGTAILSENALSGSTNCTATGTGCVAMPIVPDPSSSQPDTVGCASTTITIAVEVCVTHLDNDNAGSYDVAQMDGAEQANWGGNSVPAEHPGLLDGVTHWIGAATWVNNAAPDGPLIFGGDFNATPSSDPLKPVYGNIYKNGDPAQTTGQHFTELDNSGTATDTGGQIDHIFFKKGHTSSVSVPVGSPADLSDPPSDHKVVYGSVTLCESSC